MIKMELTAVRKAAHMNKTIHKALEQAVRKTVQDIHEDATSRAPVDTGRLRNNMIWSINGKEYGGQNSFATTSPESPWGHKPGARPVGDPADLEDASALLKFPVNDDKHKTIGYVGNNVKRDGHAPYGVYQELGWKPKGSDKVHMQPYFRPAIYEHGVDPTVRPTFLRALQNTNFGPLIERKVKK